MTTLSLGYSPCPNDTYIFHALIHGQIPCGELPFTERLEDVETLNQLALQGALDLTKISFHAFGHLRDRYVLLRSGAALGRGTTAQQDVTIAQVAKGMKGNLGQIQGSLQGQLVEGFDIFKAFGKGQLTTGNLAMNQGMKDVGIIGTGRIAKA